MPVNKDDVERLVSEHEFEDPKMIEKAKAQYAGSMTVGDLIDELSTFDRSTPVRLAVFESAGKNFYTCLEGPLLEAQRLVRDTTGGDVDWICELAAVPVGNLTEDYKEFLENVPLPQ